MKRLVGCLALSWAVLGCSNNNMNGKADLSMGGGDGPTPQDMAMAAAAPSGSACTMTAMCAGAGATMGKCEMTLLNAAMTPLPGGYCTSNCQSAKNDSQTNINPQCPGGSGTCADNIFSQGGNCFMACNPPSIPCNTGYSCFFAQAAMGNTDICLPTAASECNPTSATSCPQDGGVTTDAGTMPGRTCLRQGPDDVGACATGCDLFKQDCDPDAQGNPQGCYETFDTGQGFCIGPGSIAAGMPCVFLNDCVPGYACFYGTGMKGTCRKFCGGPNNVPCAAGTCARIFGTQGPMVNQIGACTM
jgi:hypothetical protein